MTRVVYCNGPFSWPHSTTWMGPIQDTIRSHCPALRPAHYTRVNAIGPDHMNPEIRSFHHQDTFTWSHVVVDAASRHAAIIDPALDFDPVTGQIETASAQRLLEYIETTALQVDWILETHVHADHLTAAAWLKARLGAAGTSPRIGIGRGVLSVQRTFKQKLDLGDEFAADGREFDALFDDGAEITIGNLPGRAMTTPGHTADSLSYVFGNAAFIGDTLFAPRSGSARCDFPGGDAQVLFDSIQRLYALPDATRVFLAHDYPPEGEAPLAETSIAAQKAGNIHVRAGATASDFVEMRKARDATLGMPRLFWPSIQSNLLGGRFPPANAQGQSYLKMPLGGEALESLQLKPAP